MDTHQHFWDIDRFEYWWLTPDRKVLRRNFLPEDLKPLLSEAGVDLTVAVQAHNSLEEAHWLLRMASAHDFLAGVVGWVDLTSPNLGRDLDELQQHPKFKGVRHSIEAEPDDAWMLGDAAGRGLAELARREIPYDLVIWPRHVKYLPQLREKHPRLKLVIDHIALTPIATGKLDVWDRDMEIAAHLPDIL